MGGLPRPAHDFPYFSNNNLTLVLIQPAYAPASIWQAQKVLHPCIGFVLIHSAGIDQGVDAGMCLAPRQSGFPVGNRTDRDVSSFSAANVAIAGITVATVDHRFSRRGRIHHLFSDELQRSATIAAVLWMKMTICCVASHMHNPDERVVAIVSWYSGMQV